MNPINPMKLMKIKSAIDQFKQNHPKFPMFLSAVTKDGMQPGTVIEITVTNPEGNTYNSNLKLSESDIQLIQELKSMTQL